MLEKLFLDFRGSNFIDFAHKPPCNNAAVGNYLLIIFKWLTRAFSKTAFDPLLVAKNCYLRACVEFLTDYLSLNVRFWAADINIKILKEKKGRWWLIDCWHIGFIIESYHCNCRFLWIQCLPNQIWNIFPKTSALFNFQRWIPEQVFMKNTQLSRTFPNYFFVWPFVIDPEPRSRNFKSCF